VLVDAHTPKQGAAATFKRGFGFHPLGAWLDRGDGTGEALAVVLREGRAGSNTAADHVGLLAMALAALPAGQRRTRGVLVRCDAAGATHGLLDACRAWGARFSVGFDVTAKVRQAIAAVPRDGWVAALDSHGRPRSDAHVAELASLELPGWPPGSRVLCRREPATAGARASGKPVDQAGRRLQAVLTDQPDTDVAVVERRHRPHASVDDRNRCAKATGLRNLPCHHWAANDCWVALVALAGTLTCWAQTLLLDGDLRVAEPKTLRFRLWHVPARLARHARTRWLRLPGDWPWAGALARGFARLAVLGAG